MQHDTTLLIKLAQSLKAVPKDSTQINNRVAATRELQAQMKRTKERS